MVAISPNDVWADGYYNLHTMTMHWDGSTWRIVSSPAPGNRFSIFWGIGADGTTVWAVGHHCGRHIHSLICRWDGSRWVLVPAPSFDNWSPTAASGSSSNDVWFIGSEPTSSLVIAHWDGRVVSTVLAPEKRGYPGPGVLKDVVAISSNDAWAVGWSNTVQHHHQPMLLMHWDGSTWSLEKPPRLGPATR